MIKNSTQSTHPDYYTLRGAPAKKLIAEMVAEGQKPGIKVSQARASGICDDSYEQTQVASPTVKGMLWESEFSKPKWRAAVNISKSGAEVPTPEL